MMMIIKIIRINDNNIYYNSENNNYIHNDTARDVAKRRYERRASLPFIAQNLWNDPAFYIVITNVHSSVDW